MCDGVCLQRTLLLAALLVPTALYFSRAQLASIPPLTTLPRLPVPLVRVAQSQPPDPLTSVPTYFGSRLLPFPLTSSPAYFRSHLRWIPRAQSLTPSTIRPVYTPSRSAPDVAPNESTPVMAVRFARATHTLAYAMQRASVTHYCDAEQRCACRDCWLGAGELACERYGVSPCGAARGAQWHAGSAEGCIFNRHAGSVHAARGHVPKPVPVRRANDLR